MYSISIYNMTGFNMTRGKFTGNYDGSKFNNLLGSGAKGAGEKESERSTSSALKNSGDKGGSGKKGGLGGLLGKLSGQNQKKKMSYEDMMKKRIEDYMQQKVIDRITNKGTYIEGADNDGASKMSDAAVKAIKQMFEKRAREKAAKEMEVKIKPMNLRNGRIDAQGFIYTYGGRKVGFVDKKKGIICNNFGFKVAKYDPKSFGVVGELERLIDNFRASNKRNNQPLSPMD